MRNRVRKGKALIRTAALLPVILGLALMASPMAAQDQAARRIKVKLAIDWGIQDRAESRIAAARLLDDCFRTFRRWCPLDLRLADVVTWTPDPGSQPLAERLGELHRKVRRGSCDIVLGVMAPERTKAITLGIASYPRAYVLVKNLASRRAMTYAILHELSHVFGAVDIREEGSIMGLEKPALSIDPFTTQVVRLNAGRSFDRKGPTVSASVLDGIVSLFEDRAGRGLPEPHVQLFLTLLYLEKGDFEAAGRTFAAAAEGDPEIAGLHNLAGTICLFREDYDQALTEFRKALECQPYEPGIRFNIGLTYVQMGLLDEAAAAFRETLKADGEYGEARRALDLVLKAGLDARAAKTAFRQFLPALQEGR